MQIYVSKNNQQSGPFEEAKVLEMLRGGQLSPRDFGLRQDVKQWKPLGEMFQISAPLPGNSGVQNIVSWAKQNLPNQLFVQYKPVSSELKVYLITLGVLGVLPVLVGLILKILNVSSVGILLTFIGGILFVVLLLMFALIFLLNRFRVKKFAAVFNSQGVVTNSNVLYEWDKLQYMNFIKYRQAGVHGQGLIPALIAALAIYLIRRAMFKDPRQKQFNGAEFIFANGKVIIPTTMKNFAEIWDFIEKVPVQPRFDGRFDQNTIAELQKSGLYKTQNTAALPNPQLPTAQINQMPLQPNIPQPPPNQIIQPPPQLNPPTAAKKSTGVWIFAGVLIVGLLLVGAVGIFAGYYFYFSSRTVDTVSNGNSKDNSNSSQTVSEMQTFPDPSPDKKPDFTMTAEEFYRDAGDYSKEKQALAKYGGKIVEISGRVDLFKEFDGKGLYFQVPSMYLQTELLASEANKLPNIKEGARVKVKCDVVDEYRITLKNCVVLERKPAVIADEKPDFSITAKEYYEQVANYNLSYETRQKNRAKYFGKILEISGKVQKIGGDGYFLSVRENEWVTCYPDNENKPLFAKLTEGQEAKFKGVDDGNALRHCIVSR